MARHHKSLESLLVILAVAGAIVGGGEAAIASGTDFCQERLLVDYEKPLRKLADINRPPLSGASVGARGMVLSRPSNRLVIGRGPVGMAFENRTGRTLRKLDLEVVLNLQPLGHAHRVALERKRFHLKAPGPYEQVPIGFNLESGPGIYGMDARFFDRKSGRQVAVYSEHFRVVRPSRHVHLAVSTASVKPGEKVSYRLLNGGASYFGFGLEFEVQHRSGEGWKVDESLTPAGFLQPAFGLGPGLASDCEGVRIPESTAPGMYRIVKGLRAFGLPRGPRHISRAATFEIAN